MQKMYNNSNYLQVDYSVSMKEKLTLNNKIKEDIINAADWLWKLSDANIGLKHLTEYHVEFLEKYGVNREVPLLELLSEEKGLGPPPTYKYPNGTKSYKSNQDSTVAVKSLLQKKDNRMSKG